MLLFWIPLDMPIKFTLSRMKGAQTIEATSVKQLENAGVRVGDTLHLSGTGNVQHSHIRKLERTAHHTFSTFRLLTDYLE